MRYTTKGAGALLVPIAAGMSKVHGWGTVFGIAMTFNLIAAALALFVLKPMRARHFARLNDGVASAPDAVVGTRPT